LLIGVAIGRLQAKPIHYILGGGFKFGAVETILVIASSVIFGVAHWIGGWPAWKVPDAAVAGLAFGYLFLKYGLPSAILMHFINDYLSLPVTVFSSTSAGFGIIVSLLFLLWAIMGSVLFVYYIIRATEFLAHRTFFEGRTAPLAMPGLDPRQYGSYPQPYSFAPDPNQQVNGQSGVVTQQPHVGHGFTGGYVCPACGYTQARWADGKFQCLRCGNVS